MILLPYNIGADFALGKVVLVENLSSFTLRKKRKIEGQNINKHNVKGFFERVG